MLVAHSLHPETLRHAHRMSSDDDGVIRDLNALIIDLHEKKIWSLLDSLVVVTDDSGDSLLNIVSSDFDAYLSGSPSFTANTGYAVDQTADEFVAIELNPVDDSCQLTEDSGHFFCWTNAGTVSPLQAVSAGTFDQSSGTLLAEAGSNKFWPNFSAPVYGPLLLSSPSPQRGFRMVSRTSAGVVNARADGVTGSASIARSSTFDDRATVLAGTGRSGDIECGAYAGGSGTLTFCAMGAGAGMSITQMGYLYDALSTYLTSRGAI